MDRVTEPLDLGCHRIEVDTTDGYQPTLDDLVRLLETLHRNDGTRTADL